MNFYAANADRLFQTYRAASFEQVHASWLHLITKHAGLVLDVCAGSGRDAEWIAAHGHEFVAVEPCAELRQLASARTPASVRWLNDSLPGLKDVHDIASDTM